MNTPSEPRAPDLRRPIRQSSPRIVTMRRYGKWLRDVEAHMHRVALGDHVELTGRMACSQLSTGGKRLRARLALAAADALNVDRLDAIRWAAAVELLHNATLVHDDIQDGDTVRRGHPTLWTMHGVSQAINAGDLMLMLPFLAIAELPVALRGDLSIALASHAARIVRGQVAEIELLNKKRTDPRSYRLAIEGKTGALMGLCVAGAAILAGHGQRLARQLSNAFVELGVLFQLQDDVLDLYGNKGRAEVGCDLYEGKVSALVVAHLQRWPQDRTTLLSLLLTPREHTSPEQVDHIISLFRHSGALDDVLNQIRVIEQRILTSDILRNEPELYTVALELTQLATTPIADMLDDEHLSDVVEVA